MAPLDLVLPSPKLVNVMEMCISATRLAFLSCALSLRAPKMAFFSQPKSSTTLETLSASSATLDMSLLAPQTFCVHLVEFGTELNLNVNVCIIIFIINKITKLKFFQLPNVFPSPTIRTRDFPLFALMLKMFWYHSVRM
jgi:hypothetical protein